MRLESLGLDANIVRARTQERYLIGAQRVGCGGAFYAALGVGDLYLRVGNQSASLICNSSSDARRTYVGLSECSGGANQEGNKQPRTYAFHRRLKSPGRKMWKASRGAEVSA